MRKQLIVLLGLTTVFNLLFWLMIANGYTLRGSIVGLSATAIVGSIAIVLFAVLVARVIKPTASKLYVLPAIASILVLAFLVSRLQGFSFGDELLCSKRYPSPSGWAAIVVEDHEVLGDFSYSSADFDWLIFRKYVGHYPGGGICDERFTTFKWSADERQVDWRTLGKRTLDRQGRWQF